MKTEKKLLIRLTDESLRDLEQLVRSEPDLPSRAEVIRRLLAAEAARRREATAK